MAEKEVRNLPDQGAKLVFGNAEMCAQFFDDYISIPCLKGLRPEQIEDASARFVSLWDNERNSDVVKRIRLSEEENVYVVAIIEHQSRVDYTTCMKILRYMVMIWTDYEREMERLKEGITQTKAFRYPPIFPVVYYEGTDRWTAATRLSERIALADAFGEYLPDYRYEVIRVHDYSDEEIVEKGNSLSLVMLLNKLYTSDDVRRLKNIPREYLESIQNASTKQVLKLVCDVMGALLRRLNVPDREIDDITDQILEKGVSMFFDSFQAYDVQAIRKESREEARKEVREEVWKEVREEVWKEVREEVWKEVREEVWKEVREEVRRELQEEIQEYQQTIQGYQQEVQGYQQEVQGYQQKAQGYQQKIQALRQSTENQWILNTIRICRDLDISSDRILEQLMQKYQLTETAAREYMERS